MIRNAIRRFMYGRYGNDQLNLFLVVLYLALYLKPGAVCTQPVPESIVT